MNMTDPKLAQMYAQYLAGGIARQLAAPLPQGPRIAGVSMPMPEGGVDLDDMAGDVGEMISDLFGSDPQAEQPGVTTGTPLEFDPSIMPPTAPKFDPEAIGDLLNSLADPTPNPHPPVYTPPPPASAPGVAVQASPLASPTPPMPPMTPAGPTPGGLYDPIAPLENQFLSELAPQDPRMKAMLAMLGVA